MRAKLEESDEGYKDNPFLFRLLASVPNLRSGNLCAPSEV